MTAINVTAITAIDASGIHIGSATSHQGIPAATPDTFRASIRAEKIIKLGIRLPHYLYNYHSYPSYIGLEFNVVRIYVAGFYAQRLPDPFDSWTDVG